MKANHEKMFDRVRANGYMGKFVGGKNYTMRRGVPKPYMWIGQFLISVCHTRATLAKTTADVVDKICGMVIHEGTVEGIFPAAREIKLQSP